MCGRLLDMGSRILSSPFIIAALAFCLGLDASAGGVEFYDEDHVIVDGVIMSIDYIESQFTPMHSVYRHVETESEDGALSDAGAGGSDDCANCRNEAHNLQGFEFLKAQTLDGVPRYSRRELRDQPEMKDLLSRDWSHRFNSVVAVRVPYFEDKNQNGFQDPTDPSMRYFGTAFMTACDGCFLTSAHTFFENFGEPGQRLRGRVGNYLVISADDLQSQNAIEKSVTEILSYGEYVARHNLAHPENPIELASGDEDLLMIRTEPFKKSYMAEIKLRSSSEPFLRDRVLVNAAFHSDVSYGRVIQVQRCHGRAKGTKSAVYAMPNLAIGECSNGSRSSGSPYFNADGTVSAVHRGALGGNGPFNADKRYSFMNVVTPDVVNFVRHFAEGRDKRLRQSSYFLKQRETERPHSL